MQCMCQRQTALIKMHLYTLHMSSTPHVHHQHPVHVLNTPHMSSTPCACPQHLTPPIYALHKSSTPHASTSPQSNHPRHMCWQALVTRLVPAGAYMLSTGIAGQGMGMCTGLLNGNV